MSLLQKTKQTKKERLLDCKKQKDPQIQNRPFLQPKKSTPT